MHEYQFTEDQWHRLPTGTGYSVPFYPSGEDNFETGSFQNMGGYSDPTMDKLINANISIPGMQPLYDYETYVSEQQPFIFGPRERSGILVSNRLACFTPPATMSRLLKSVRLIDSAFCRSTGDRY